jgi:hypothetical protein
LPTDLNHPAWRHNTQRGSLVNGCNATDGKHRANTFQKHGPLFWRDVDGNRITVFSCASFSEIIVRPSCAELPYTATLAESEGSMFGGLNKKAARQSLFNVEINARRLMLVSNKAYQADPDDKQAFRADTEKILKVEDDLYRDISLALDNGASLDEICYRIEIAKIKEATVGLQAKMAIDDFVKVLAAHIKQSA